ncbi:acid protease [Wolfiporia cocos MD-104 SS10]|uniref:Acid protease n=1 Tax=Wolfiporia cocos (strain MD-104) TaxID=742152 RepID=A0A2H3JED8_WOLCO|nr:acid protease [Wolfiporia cocos MD-104 SS10]
MDTLRASRAWKGKQREQVYRREGSGGSAGVVLPLELLTSSQYESVYTIPVIVGRDRQNMSLQVDTGSSDLWIASRLCSSSSCSQTDGHLYDPTSAKRTNETLYMNYAEGSVSGPIVWDYVELGGYNVSNQALAAAASVTDEPLAYDYNGVLGLALPLDSEISQLLPAGTSNSPDGAAFTSNLFSMTPSSSAPSAPFLSLTLERPGSNRISSNLGIGRHPSQITDPTKVNYADVVESQNGATWWKAYVEGITVWVDGKPQTIDLSDYVPYPTAVVDSGTPIILAAPAIASSIYGALGISPSSNGYYYVSCTLPINMTITLDSRPAIPLHPLDLSYPTSDGSCMGMIQNSAIIGSDYVELPDLVLGVPFMRNTYTVMAYEPPENGVFLPNETLAGSGANINPVLGLLGLTNITVALEEFHQVRVLNEPLDGGTTTTSEGPQSLKHLSVGIDILIGCVGFLLLCAAVFGARWLYLRRKWRKSPPAFADEEDGKDSLSEVAYILARRGSATDRYSRSDDGLQGSRASRYTHRKDVPSQYTDISSLTRVDGAEALDGLGVLRDRRREGSPDRATLVSRDSFMNAKSARFSHAYSYTDSSPPPSPEFVPRRIPPPSPPARTHHRLVSGEDPDWGIAMPLLAHTRRGSHRARSDDGAELGVPRTERESSYGGSTLGSPSPRVFEAALPADAGADAQQPHLEDHAHAGSRGDA